MCAQLAAYIIIEIFCVLFISFVVYTLYVQRNKQQMIKTISFYWRIRYAAIAWTRNNLFKNLHHRQQVIPILLQVSVKIKPEAIFIVFFLLLFFYHH